MDFGGSSVPGPRPYNEDDSLLIDMSGSQKRLGGLKAFLMVSDGMGGHSSGDVASRVAVDTAQEYVGDLLSMAETADVDVDAALALREISEEAHDAVVAAAADRGATSMGATYVAALVSSDRAWIGHVGDSRAYLLARSGARQLTIDHSQIGRMIAEGILTEEQAQSHPQRNVIERALGFGEASADTLAVDLQKGDAILLCSDGVSTALTGDEMLEIAAGAPDAKSAAERLTTRAIEAGGDDNATAVIWSDDWAAFRGTDSGRRPSRPGGQRGRRLARHDRAQRASLVAVGLVVLVAAVIAGVALAGSGATTTGGGTVSSTVPTATVQIGAPAARYRLEAKKLSGDAVYLREMNSRSATKVAMVSAGTVLSAAMKEGDWYLVYADTVRPGNAAPIQGVETVSTYGSKPWPKSLWVFAGSVTVIDPK